VLVVDREADEVRARVAHLREHGFDAMPAHDAEGALNTIAHTRVDALVCALDAPRIDGLAVLAALRARRPDACAILLSDGPDLGRAVEAMRRGAWDVQERPGDSGRLLAALERGLEHLALAERAVELEDEIVRRDRRAGPAGGSRAMQRVREQVAQVAPTRATVLIEGEEGVGKGVIARALHLGSPRAGGPFVRFDCASLPEEMFEPALFGVESGAGIRRGRAELAEGGTLVLDGAEHLPAHAQVLLLRLLQDRGFERAGGTRTVRADVRVLATASGDLGEAVREARFREDLFYQLAVVRIAVPPLRERPEDIPVLVEHLLRELAREHGRRPRRVTRGLMDRLVAHAWPGNVAELKHALEGLLLTAKGRGALDLTAMPAALRGAAPETAPPEVRVGMTLDESERALIEATLRHADGDKVRTAALLGIGLRTLYRKLDRYRRG
jgi:DNA-binding NtrC family response regulator